MGRRLAPCDFCGSVQGLRSYPADARGIEWHSCEVCAASIRNEDWDKLIERIITAFAALQYISERDRDAFRHELQTAFRQPLEDDVNVPCQFLFPAGLGIGVQQ